MYSKVGAKDADLLVIGKKRISRKRMFFICVLFAATVFSALSVFEKLNAPAPTPVDTNVRIVAHMPKPESGSPSDMSAAENFYIAAGVLYDSGYFEGDTSGTITASVFGAPYNQSLEGHRVSKSGRLFHEINSTSTVKSVGEQRFFAQDTILMRTAKYKKGEPVWGTIGLVKVDDFSAKYGLIPREICLYVVNDDTILDSGFVSSENGLSTYWLNLDPEKAPERYKRQVGTLGGASDFPEFESIKLTFTIDSEWNIQSHTVEEVYDISIAGLGSMTCRAALTETFSNIGATDRDFPDAAKEFIDLAPGSVGDLDTTPVMSAADYLAEAFGGYLGGDAIEFTADLDALGLKTGLTGYLDIANMDIRVQVGDLLYAAYGNDNVYLKVGDGKVRIPVSSLTGVIDELKPIMSEMGIDINIEELMSSLTSGDLLGTLFADSEIIENGDEVHIIMPFELMSIGFDIDMHLVKRGGKFAPKAINAVLDLKKLGLDKYFETEDGTYKAAVKVNFASASLPAPDESFAEFDASFIKEFIPPVKALATAKAYDVNGGVKIGNTEITLSGTVVNADGMTVAAKAEFMGITADIKFVDETVYISAGNLKLRAAISDLPALMNGIMPLIPDSENITGAIDGIKNALAGLDIKSGLEKALLFIPSLSFENGELSLSIKGANVSVTPGDDSVALKIDGISAGDKSVSVNASVTAIAEETAPITVEGADEYVPAVGLLPFIDPIKTLLQSESFSVGLSGTVINDEIAKYFDSTNVAGKMTVNLGRTENGSPALQLYDFSAFGNDLDFSLIEGIAYLSLNDNINLSLDLKNTDAILTELQEALNRLLAKDKQLTDEKKAEIVGTVNKILDLDIGGLMKFDAKTLGKVLGAVRELSYKDGTLTAVVSIKDFTVTATLFAPEKDSGKLEASVTLNYSPADKTKDPLDATFSVTLSDFSSEPVTLAPAAHDYITTMQLCGFIKPVLHTIDAKEFNIEFGGSFDGKDADGNETSTVISGRIQMLTVTEISNASFPETYLTLSIGDKTNPKQHNISLLAERKPLLSDKGEVVTDENGVAVKSNEVAIYANYNGMKITLGYRTALKIVGAVCDMLKLDVPMINNLTSGVYNKGDLDTSIFDDANMAGLTDAINKINSLFKAVDGEKSAFDALISKVLYNVLSDALKGVTLNMNDDSLVIGIDNSLINNVIKIISKEDGTAPAGEETGGPTTPVDLGKATVSVSHDGNKLSTLNISNLAFGGNTVSLNATLLGEGEPMPTSQSAEFSGNELMDFNSIYDFIEQVINTANIETGYFPISGEIKISGLANASLYFNLGVAIIENPERETDSAKPKTKVLLGLKIWSNLGYLNPAGFAIDKADSYLYFDGDNLYMQRDNYKRGWGWEYSNTKSYKFSPDQFGANAMNIIFDLIPLKQSIIDEITKSNTGDGTSSIKIEDVLKSYKQNGNTISIGIGLAELTGTDMLRPLNVDLKSKTIDNRDYICEVSGKTDIALLNVESLHASFTATLKNVNENNLARPLDNIQFGHGWKESEIDYTKLAETLSSATWKNIDEVYPKTQA